VDINIPDMLLSLRHDLEHVQEPLWRVGMKAYSFGFSHPLLFEFGGRVASRATRAVTGLLNGKGEAEDGTIRALPYPLNGWTQNRDFPPFAQQSFHDWWRENREKKDD
jgi:L-lactate dehydrogenase complex protein LldF